MIVDACCQAARPRVTPPVTPVGQAPAVLLQSSFMTAAAPAVSIIVVPRERFSCAQASLESIYANTPPVFELLYVDAGSPNYVRQYLDSAAARHGFRLIRAAWGIAPNPARNLALVHARGHTIVFVDNDVQVAPGWLQALLACANETGAGMVSPLVYLGEFEQRVVHMSGGELGWEMRDGQRWLNESHRHFNLPLAQAGTALKREPCGYAEFHCMLVRRDVLDAVATNPGPLDEQLLGVAEHIDLSLRCAAAGHPVWFEPSAQVAFLSPRPAALSDIAYVRVRWSHDWTERSADHFARQWQLHADCPAVAGARNFSVNHRAALQFPAEPALVDGFCAQTDIQLHEQCQALGYHDGQLALIQRACEFSQGRIGHLHDGSGRPLLAHVIGAASLLAAHGVAPRFVATALLQVAHGTGQRAVDASDIRAAQRQQIAALVTPAGETIIHLFATFNWNQASIHELLSRADEISLPFGMALLIRLANALEELVSHGAPCDPHAAAALRSWLPLYVEVANLLGMPLLARRVQQAVQGDPGSWASRDRQVGDQAPYSTGQVSGL